MAVAPDLITRSSVNIRNRLHKFLRSGIMYSTLLKKLNLVFSFTLLFSSLLANHGFPRETLVQTIAGSRPIEELGYSHTIMCFDFEDVHRSSVIKRHTDTELLLTVAVIVEDFKTRETVEMIHCGYQQKFYSASRNRWVEAQNLCQDDILVSSTHGLMRCNGIWVFSSGRRHLMSLEIENWHNFFVGKHSILVHNYMPAPSVVVRVAWLFGGSVATGTLSWNVGIGIGILGLAGLGFGYFMSGEEAKNGPYAEFDADRFGQQFNKKPEYHHENFAGSSQNTYAGFGNDESTTEEPGSEEYEHTEETTSQSFASTAAGGEDLNMIQEEKETIHHNLLSKQI